MVTMCVLDESHIAGEALGCMEDDLHRALLACVGHVAPYDAGSP